jgi:IPT/TIG domain
MYGRWAALASLTLLSCDPYGFKLVSISPIYGWVDGCTDVTVSGHGFDDDITVTIGGTALANLTLPDADANPLDVGYLVRGQTPAGSAGGTFATVSVTSGGETSELVDAFYYETCWYGAYPESADPTEGVTSGATISLSGCNLTAGSVQVRVGTSSNIDLTSVCGSAQATFTAPAVADGCHYLSFYDSAGTELFPASGCDVSLDCSTDQSVTADTGVTDPCSGVPTLTYGGGR